MHRLAGAQAAAHCWQVPSLDRAHCLYVRSAGSNMQASAGVHGAPKWKHAPAPPDRHVKYAPAPAWNAQLGVGQPITGSATGAPATGLPLAGGAAGAAGVAVVTGAAPECPAGLGPVGGWPAGGPQPRTSAAAIAITKRTARL